MLCETLAPKKINEDICIRNSSAINCSTAAPVGASETTHFNRREYLMKRGWLASLLAAAVVLPMAARGADDAKAPETPPAKATSNSSDTTPAKPLKGRLPQFYAKLSIDPQQKTKIYEIEATFSPKLKALRDQLEALEAEQRDQIKAVLTPEQQDKLKTLIAESRTGKRHEATPAATTTPTPPTDKTTAPTPATTTPTPAPTPK
jgi:Spy/CpxP family protein refolding chaperone